MGERDAEGFVRDPAASDNAMPPDSRISLPEGGMRFRIFIAFPYMV
jgi:hypothetical protein